MILKCSKCGDKILNRVKPIDNAVCFPCKIKQQSEWHKHKRNLQEIQKRGEAV